MHKSLLGRFRLLTLIAVAALFAGLVSATGAYAATGAHAAHVSKAPHVKAQAARTAAVAAAAAAQTGHQVSKAAEHHLIVGHSAKNDTSPKLRNMKPKPMKAPKHLVPVLRLPNKHKNASNALIKAKGAVQLGWIDVTRHAPEPVRWRVHEPQMAPNTQALASRRKAGTTAQLRQRAI